MLAHVHAMLDRHADLIHTGDFAGVADLYDFPLGIHVKGELLVYRSRPAFLDGLHTLIASYRDDGIQAIRWNIAAIELVRDRRFRLWISWDHICGDQIRETAAEVTYFCRLGPDRLHVEMVQYQAMAAAVLAAQIERASRKG